MDQFLSHYEVFFRLLIAALLGGLIGFERERVSWFAGLRTHMLVCVGAALIMMVSKFGFEDVLKTQLVVLDPSRVAAQVVSGIGFLGAGTILVWKNVIRGLTTAASLWTVAAVGLSVGSGMYIPALITTALLLIILAGLKPLERYFFKKKSREKEIKFIVHSAGFSLTSLRNALAKADLSFKVLNLKIEVTDVKKEIVNLTFGSTSQANLLSIIDEVRKLPGVEGVELLENQTYA